MNSISSLHQGGALHAMNDKECANLLADTGIMCMYMYAYVRPKGINQILKALIGWGVYG